MKHYRAEIDGLRAVAVIPVVLFHAGFSWIGGGYAGVDVFFVISGYLITTILYTEIRSGSFSILGFYERRARRIIPALALICVASILPAWILMRPEELEAFAKSLIGVAIYASNVSFLLDQGYFEESAELIPLLHTWSLGVEEQFYIIFPFFLLVLLKKNADRANIALVLVISLSVSLSIWATNIQSQPTTTSSAFFLLHTRAWELGIGALVAMGHAQRRDCFSKRWVNEVMSLVGIALIIFSFFAYTPTTPFPGIASIPPTIGAALVVAFASSPTFVAKILSLKIFVSVGLLSYSVYLWHNPIFAFFRIYQKQIELPWEVISILIFATFLLSYLTWRFVEKPFRNKKFLSRKSILVLTACVSGGLVFFGLISIQASKFYESKLANELENAKYVYATNIDDRRFAEARLLTDLPKVDVVAMGSSRLMQLSSSVIERSFINFSVGGAAVEDFIAFTPEAVTQLTPKVVLLGSDPWIFNKNNGLDRWETTVELYMYWARIINKSESNFSPFLQRQSNNRSGNMFSVLYNRINIASNTTDSGNNEAVAKISFDGSLVYGKAFATKDHAAVKRTFTAQLTYAMKQFEFDREAEEQYRALIDWLLEQNIEVKLVLSPYHPELYAEFAEMTPEIYEAELLFRNLAKQKNIDVLGSYNPSVTGCSASEFYDGIHPKESCINKIFHEEDIAN